MRLRIGTDIWAEPVFKYTASQHGLYWTRPMTCRAESLLTEKAPANCDNAELKRATLGASELNKNLCGFWWSCLGLFFSFNVKICLFTLGLDRKHVVLQLSWEMHSLWYLVLDDPGPVTQPVSAPPYLCCCGSAQGEGQSNSGTYCPCSLGVERIGKEDCIFSLCWEETKCLGMFADKCKR